MLHWRWLVALAAAVTAAAASKTSGVDPVPYPEGYRHWVHVKSQLIGPGRSSHGLHHIYANEQALLGYQTARFPEGSVLVFDLLEVATADDVTVEGSRRHIDVMHKDSTRFADTGGWGFEEFRGDSREPALDAPARMRCLQCHTKMEDRGLVFSAFRR